MIEPEVVFESSDQVLVIYCVRLKLDLLNVLMLERPWKPHRQPHHRCHEKENNCHLGDQQVSQRDDGLILMITVIMASLFYIATISVITMIVAEDVAVYLRSGA